MADILFIKTSSLGDVIHHLPAVTDVRGRLPDARIAWVVEEAFAPLVRLHPGVSEVVPVASRRWRKSLYAPETMADIGRNLRAIRARAYGEIVDSQGLLRSAIIARVARGRRHGYDRSSIREPVAALLYDVRHTVSRALHAIDRNRILTGLALGYSPEGAARYGLDRSRLSPAASKYAVLLHATARPEKEWAEENWIALGNAIQSSGMDLVLPWGNEVERSRSERLASVLPHARVGERRPLDDVARLIAGASFVVGVDTGLLHLAAALGVPLVAIFTETKPELTGPRGSGPIAIVGSEAGPPSVDEVVRAVERIAP
ncbi:MAG TPA: lipopolysaccharide heptosyltransferase I [Pseudolabrys sp.]|jgi:heptosyltransferase-1|nr:lipopolysaccharide heptosyltransferase I [Pseudolabrys sp.]